MALFLYRYLKPWVYRHIRMLNELPRINNALLLQSNQKISVESYAIKALALWFVIILLSIANILIM